LARGLIRKKLEELVDQNPRKLARFGRPSSANLKEQARLELMIGIRGSDSRARALAKIRSELRWSHREMALRLDISVSTLTKYLNPGWRGHISLQILHRILALRGQSPTPSLRERFQTAAKKVFGAYYRSGIPQEHLRRPLVKALAELMELDERAGYRLLA